MAKHKCIYCLQEKEEKDFNREHVVPRMMGTYENGFVLNRYQVCQDCNSFFSRELEDKISLNSMECFLRLQHGRPMSDGRKMKKGRVSFEGTSGVVKGLEFTPVVDNSNEEKMQFNIAPRIGIMSNEDLNEYSYYTVEELPEATEDILQFIKHKKNGIITVGIRREEAEPVLKAKGYLTNEYKYRDASVIDLHDEPSFNTNIHFSIDYIIRRICAKTVFNYLCYTYGKEFVLAEKFDDIRNYIRYGAWSDKFWFRYSIGPVSAVSMPNETAHVVGSVLYPEGKKWTLCGCLTWFGELTYIFRIADAGIEVGKINFLPSTQMACFDNENKTIMEDDAVYVYPGRAEEK